VRGLLPFQHPWSQRSADDRGHKHSQHIPACPKRHAHLRAVDAVSQGRCRARQESARRPCRSQLAGQEPSKRPEYRDQTGYGQKTDKHRATRHVCPRTNASRLPGSACDKTYNAPVHTATNGAPTPHLLKPKAALSMRDGGCDRLAESGCLSDIFEAITAQVLHESTADLHVGRDAQPISQRFTLHVIRAEDAASL